MPILPKNLTERFMADGFFIADASAAGLRIADTGELGTANSALFLNTDSFGVNHVNCAPAVEIGVLGSSS